MRASTFATKRLVATPLRAGDANDMFEVQNDLALHRFVGGAPLTFEALHRRYRRLEGGRSPTGREFWLNWILRLQSQSVGTVQATVIGTEAQIAWVVGTRWQGQGLASEAAIGLVAWLASQGVDDVAARIHPQHVASQTVATRAGLSRTAETVEAEEVWRLRLANEAT